MEPVDPVDFGENISIEFNMRSNNTYISGLSNNLSIHVIDYFQVGVIQEIGNGTYSGSISTWNMTTIPPTFINIIINFSWFGEPFYENKTISLHAYVNPRSTDLILDNLGGSLYFGEQVEIQAIIMDNVNNSHIQVPLNEISATVVEDGNVDVTINELSMGLYSIAFDTWVLNNSGTYHLNVSMAWSGKPYYANKSRLIQVTIHPRMAILTYGSEVYYDFPYNTINNVTLNYLDLVNSTQISYEDYTSVSVLVRHGGTIISGLNETILPVVYGGNSWVIQINTSFFPTPSIIPYNLSVNISWDENTKPFYINTKTSFNITIISAPTQVAVYGSYQQPLGVNHTITLKYLNSFYGESIENATLCVSTDDLNYTSGPFLADGVNSAPPLVDNIKDLTVWNGSVTVDGGNYTFSFNLDGYKSISFNVTFTKQNYNARQYSFTLIKSDLPSELLLVDVETGYILGSNHSAFLLYQYQGSSVPVNNASVAVSSSNIFNESTIWPKHQYQSTVVSHEGISGVVKLDLFTGQGSDFILNNTGIIFLYIQFSAELVEPRVISIQLDIKLIPQWIESIWFNGLMNDTSSLSFTGEVNDNVSVSVDILGFDAFLGVHQVMDCTVRVYGSELTEDIILTRNTSTGYYEGSIELDLFEIGATQVLLTITKSYFTPINIPINLYITRISSELTLMNSEPLVVIYGDTIDVIFSYLVDGQLYSNANITFLDIIQGNFSYINFFYVFSLNSSKYSIGSYVTTVSATASNIVTQLKEIVIQIVPRVLEIRTNKTVYDISNGIESEILLSVFDISHGQYISSVTLTYKLSGNVLFVDVNGEGLYFIRINKEICPISKQPYSLNITAENDYGKTVSLLITVLNYPIENGDDQFLLYLILIISAMIGVVAIAVSVKFRGNQETGIQKKLKNLKSDIAKKRERILETGGEYNPYFSKIDRDKIIQNIKKSYNKKFGLS